MKIEDIDDWRNPLCGWSKVGVGAIPLAEQLDYFRKSGFSNLQFQFSKLYGYAPNDLDWVEDVPELEGVMLASRYDDASPIDRLPNVRAFSDNSEGRSNFSFKYIYDCEHLSVDYLKAHPKYEKFNNAVSFSVSNLPLRYRDLSSFDFIKLRYLSLRKAKLHSLMGLRRMESLEVLRLHSSRQLSLDMLKESPKNLKLLDIYGCKMISSLSFLQEVETLEEISLIGCGEIESLEPLRESKRLKYLYIDRTKIKEKPSKSLLSSLDQLGSSHRKYLERLM